MELGAIHRGACHHSSGEIRTADGCILLEKETRSRLMKGANAPFSFEGICL